MPVASRRVLIAVIFSVALHAVVLGWMGHGLWRSSPVPPTLDETETVITLEAPPPPPPEQTREPDPPPERTTPPVPAPDVVRPDPDRPVAYAEAPPAPTAEDWALASTYTLKNSKRYRYTWGQQVRSLMGTAFDGPNQGVVRFRIEIAPDGRLSRLETLWATSPFVEALARQAVERMPPLPPTPNGQPLVFEKTISFQPTDSYDPPIYKNDCLPDPPAFVNPYAWDGRSPPGPAVQPTAERPDPKAIEDCMRQLPEDSVEAESASDKRQLERWRSDRLGTGEPRR